MNLLSPDYTLLFYFLLFFVAFLYASVGHGGASGYLALMAIFNMAQEIMKPTALLLNLFVSMTSFIQFFRGRHFKWRIFLPFAITSVPMAYIGGLIHLTSMVYNQVLGFLLIIPIIRFLFFANIRVDQIRKSNPWLSLFIGAVIGFLSGLIGIGGGIILSPVLLLLKWTDQKQTAAISALFIFVNSASGLIAQLFHRGIYFSVDMYIYVLVAFAGGLAGAWLGALKFNQVVLKYVLAAVLMFAAWKLIFVQIK